ncbi:MAG: sensor domain-containing diguanylate cyclase [Proteobacteria bacterium]|nr:sensor domain-containing diguanylate cyclase [Pseudomonadota bacterium]
MHGPEHDLARDGELAPAAEGLRPDSPAGGFRVERGFFRKIIENAADGVLVVSEDGAICFANCETERLFGYPPGSLVGRRLEMLLPQRFRAAHAAHLLSFRHGAAEESRRMGQRSAEVFGLHSDGREIPLDATVLKLTDNDRQYLVAILRDMTAAKQLEARLREFAERDSLTGLLNRRIFRIVAQTELSRSFRYRAPISLLVADIDRFKAINDTYGHHCGDKYIRAFADILRTRTRDADTVARWGGEEFVILLPNTDRVGAETLAQHLREGVKETIVSCDNDERIKTTISIGGIAHDGRHESSPDLDKLLRLADEAMYSAKRAGRDRVVFAAH